MIRKKELIKKIQKKLKLKSFKEAEKVFNAVNESYKEGLIEKGSIKIFNIGNIYKGTKKARTIKVPNIKEKVKVPERIGLFFKTNKNFEKKLN